MKQNRFRQTCQDLWYMDGDYFSDHLWEADLGGQRLSLNKQVKCKLMELLHRLEEKHQRSTSAALIVEIKILKTHI